MNFTSRDFAQFVYNIYKQLLGGRETIYFRDVYIASGLDPLKEYRSDLCKG